MKHILLVFLVIVASVNVFGQESRDSELYKTIMEKDTELFTYGFNQCRIDKIDDLVSEDLEFYHDVAGFQDKKAFINAIKNGLCKPNSEYRSRRELIEVSVEIFPLKVDGKIYGAVQTGLHDFFEKYKDEGERFVSGARFTHTWLIKNGRWRLSRVLSYDHQTDRASLPQIATFETIDTEPDPEKINAARKALNDLSVDKFEKHTFKNAADELNYRFLRPQDPKPGEKYPLVITFHNSSRIGNDNESQLEPMARLWLRQDIAEKYKCFVLAPQFNERSSNYEKNADGILYAKPSEKLSVVITLIDKLIAENKNIDVNRIYVVGYSMGASSVQNLLNIEPRKFAAVVSIAGVPDLSDLSSFQNKNIWLVHGKLDDENRYSGSEYLFGRLKQYKRLRFTSYSKYDHNNIAAAIFMTDELPKWLFEKTR